jgi:hypothetical protein
LRFLWDLPCQNSIFRDLQLRDWYVLVTRSDPRKLGDRS